MHQPCIYRQNSCHRTLTEYQQGVLDYQNGLCGSMHDLVGMKGYEKEEEAWQDQHPGVGELKQRRPPASRGIGWDRREAVEAVREWTSWSMTVWTRRNTQTIHAMALDPGPQAGDACPLVCTGAGSWSVGTESNSRTKITEIIFLSAGVPPGRLRWIVTRSVPKDSDSFNSKKNVYYFYVLISSLLVLGVFCYILFCFLSFSLLWWLLFLLFLLSLTFSNHILNFFLCIVSFWLWLSVVLVSSFILFLGFFSLYSIHDELQCFGRLMWSTNSLEKTLTLGKIGRQKVRRWQADEMIR